MRTAAGPFLKLLFPIRISQRYPATSPLRSTPSIWGPNETAVVCDINGDGKQDVVSGENWYNAPARNVNGDRATTSNSRTSARAPVKQRRGQRGFHSGGICARWARKYMDING